MIVHHYMTGNKYRNELWQGNCRQEVHIIGCLYIISLHTSFWFTVLFLYLHKMTPLHLAAESGHIKILYYLVDEGADINIQDDNGVITCICAIKY